MRARVDHALPGHARDRRPHAVAQRHERSHDGTDSTASWLARLKAAGVPCGPVNDFSQTFEDPQVRHRGIRVDLPLPDGGICPSIASPMRFSATPLEHSAAPPALGEHTDTVLTECLGLLPAELARLREAGAI